MKKIGFLLTDLGPSQLAYYLMRSALDARGVDVILFYEEARRPCLPLGCAAMPACEAWSFDGDVVATTARTADQLRLMQGPARRYFYVWDLEWVRHDPKSWGQFAAYRDPQFALVARSPSHKFAIETAWNRPVGHVVEKPTVEAFSCLTGC